MSKQKTIDETIKILMEIKDRAEKQSYFNVEGDSLVICQKDSFILLINAVVILLENSRGDE